VLGGGKSSVEVLAIAAVDVGLSHPREQLGGTEICGGKMLWEEQAL
jgi:hypothetical protein